VEIYGPIYIDPTGENNVIDEYKSIVKPGAHIGVEVNLKLVICLSILDVN
jgi:hypothetical protein